MTTYITYLAMMFPALILLANFAFVSYLAYYVFRN